MTPPRADFYAALGPDGLADLVDPAKTKADLRLVRGLCRGATTVLDLACGYGRISLPLAQDGLQVAGLDLDAALIARARRDARGLGLKLRYAVGDMRDLPYRDDSFTRVLCLWSSFQHLHSRRDQVRCLDECWRVLRPGGTAYIEMTDGGDPVIERRLAREGRGPLRRLARWRLHGGEIACFLHNTATLSAAAAASQAAGFAVVAPRVVHRIQRLTLTLRRS